MNTLQLHNLLKIVVIERNLKEILCYWDENSKHFHFIHEKDDPECPLHVEKKVLKEFISDKLGYKKEESFEQLKDVVYSVIIDLYPQYYKYRNFEIIK